MSEVSVTDATISGNGKRQLPQGWQLVELRTIIAEAQTGFASGARDPSGVVQLRMNNVNTRGNLVWDDFIRVPLEPEKIAKYQLVNGDIVFNNTNSVELVGKSALFREHSEPAVYSNHFTRIRVVPDKIEQSYLSFWLIAQWQSRVFENLCNRWIGQSAVKNDKLFFLKIPLPSLSEQKRIVAILNEQMAAVERARAAAEAQLEAARALPAAYLREVFDGPEAQKWNRTNIDSVSSLVIDGPHKTPMYVSSGIPFVTVRNIIKRKIDFSELQYITSSDHLEFSRRGRAETGDILYTKDGTLGIPCVVDTDTEFSFFVSVALIKLMRDVVDPYFVAFALESPKVLEQVKQLGTGMGLKHMVLKSICALEIPVPPLFRQEEIATMLIEQIENLGRTYKCFEGQLGAINKLPAAILRQAFNGEL